MNRVCVVDADAHGELHHQNVRQRGATLHAPRRDTTGRRAMAVSILALLAPMAASVTALVRPRVHPQSCTGTPSGMSLN
jgi:hypothetical protein